MIIIGLTGATGAGKSMIAKRLRRRGWPIFDADREVHVMQGRGGAAIPAIARLWPEAVTEDGVVCRAALRAIVTSSPGALAALETIIHPMIEDARKRFIRTMRAAHVRACVLDIPLLIETNAHKVCDHVFVVQAPLSLRYKRIRARGGMSRKEAEALMAHQAQDWRRRQVADVLLDTGLSKAHAVAQLGRALALLGL